VCRHRGAEVVSGEGRCSTLQCHYHAWTYDLDGALRAAPRSADDPDFDRTTLGLKVNVMPGRPNMSIGPLVPEGPERTHGFLDYFFAGDADPTWVADFLALDDQVGVEDRVLVESVQSGMRQARLSGVS
jgi:hypothetical protein